MSEFSHILHWKLLRGSHDFPGPTGGTCINEAAVVACGFPYRRVGSVRSMPDCFSRPICQLAMRLNDEAADVQRQRLMPFVTRLACADTPEIERERARYIDACLEVDRFFPTMPFQFDFEDGLAVLEGALKIGRQADALGLDEAASRLDAVRGSAVPKRRRASLLPSKMKGWFGLQQAPENAD
ncbi:hypothetical protein SAMN05216360_12723 [Methylobacterium phyllostachyos]|uniref:Uncharacterized protein n=1 Tax=Methylobacterium phyllostachyos TaxID=582672 RepID=A0A1H0KHT7_9HYPH|nr:hypothetical protein [Methylobacterium phyllostachyos]SDO55548.1 hypothetical protein SAMN05216360_12723 [Methylobacterium phyllostachyos]